MAIKQTKKRESFLLTLVVLIVVAALFIFENNVPSNEEPTGKFFFSTNPFTGSSLKACSSAKDICTPDQSKCSGGKICNQNCECVEDSDDDGRIPGGDCVCPTEKTLSNDCPLKESKSACIATQCCPEPKGTASEFTYTCDSWLDCKWKVNCNVCGDSDSKKKEDHYDPSTDIIVIPCPTQSEQCLQEDCTVQRKGKLTPIPCTAAS